MSPPAARAFELILPDGTRMALTGGVVIGRDPSCQVVLQSPEVSRRHVLIELVPGGLSITDNSANGSFVGDAHVRMASLTVRASAPLTVGPFVLQLVAPPALADEARGEPAEPVVTARAATAGTALRRRIHRMLLDHLDLVSLDRKQMAEATMRPKVAEALRRIFVQLSGELDPRLDRELLIEEMCDEVLGLGPLEQLLADPTVTEIMVVSPTAIFVERQGKIEQTQLAFTDDETVRAVIERIVSPLGRRIDESTPLVDARLKDGSRVNAVIRPLALRGACITIRKFARKKLVLADVVSKGGLTEQMGRFLTRSVIVRRNILIAGGTGSGKTTLLNVLSAAIPETERIVTIEDAAELQLSQAHVVSLESRPANLEGKGEVSIRDLVRNSLRMRPDRIVVGECRGGEALDMLQAMNTGHEGSMTTLHANNPREAIGRLETLCLMAGLDLPARAIREQIAQSIHLVVQTARLSDGTRRVTSITEVAGLDERQEVVLREIFAFVRSGSGGGSTVEGEFRMTGYLPSFLDLFLNQGLVGKGTYL